MSSAYKVLIAHSGQYQMGGEFADEISAVVAGLNISQELGSTDVVAVVRVHNGNMCGFPKAIARYGNVSQEGNTYTHALMHDSNFYPIARAKREYGRKVQTCATMFKGLSSKAFAKYFETDETITTVILDHRRHNKWDVVYARIQRREDAMKWNMALSESQESFCQSSLFA